MRNPLAAFGRGRKGTPEAAGDPAPTRADIASHFEPLRDDGTVSLTIVALDLSGAASADQTRLQLQVRVRLGDPPRMIRSWELSAHIAGRVESGHPVDAHGRARSRPAIAGYGGAGSPLPHERVKTMQFALPGISRQEFLDNVAGAELVLRATDELGARWSTRLDLIALKQPE